MDLGRFSVSLSVKDLAVSRQFYETLGFSAVCGEADQGWLIMQNGEAKIGLVQGMFEGNLLTFNPADARAIQRTLKAAGIPLLVEADEPTTGPAHRSLTDPDGNTILTDQHV